MVELKLIHVSNRRPLWLNSSAHKQLRPILRSRSKNQTYYRQVSNIRRTLVGNKIVDNEDVVGASPVCAAPTTSSLST